ncbi:MAG: DNA mismatch repair protein [Sorangiineae bacterium]|nr:DNA mismatch repair protein [Polyangiaceae bacterium]MEB2321354.1 DNA mismatch repair protein [Sorangiineae bacterium]
MTDAGSLVPDLLHPAPACRLDRERTRVALELAFAGGPASALFEEALSTASLAPSRWEPGCFAGDLFLTRFVAGCLKLRIGTAELAPSVPQLCRLLGNPPAERSVVEFRRAVLGELASTPALRSALEQLYLHLARLKTLLENPEGIQDFDPQRRQLDVLAALKEVIERAATGFGGSGTGLARLTEYGRRVRESEPYRSLSDLLRYDENMATLDLRVGIGADGRIRGLSITAVEEDRQNVFSLPAWRRWLAKVELFARGYRMSDGELMARLIDAVFSGVAHELIALIQLHRDLEFYLGALGFRDAARAAGLEMCLPELVEASEPRELIGLYNPLLLMSGIQPVPCDLRTRTMTTTVLVTGPNSGGKTRLLQSVGLAQLLAQSGLFIPARAGKVALASALLVSLIQVASAEQAEGRLGMELIRIRDLFERLSPGAMVLLDELCSGTNPSEGEEIFELVVEKLSRLEPQAFITTHFLAFAARLEQEQKYDSLAFLQVELEQGSPTYQFAPGVASTSLAGQAAERLGVTGEQLEALVERSLARDRGASSGHRS